MEPEDPTDQDELRDAEYDNAPRHTWRHVRTAVTLLILVGFVVGAAWYSWDNVMEPADADESGEATSTCPSADPTDAPPPEDVEVNVYNATERAGLAQQVASEMRDRGFTILDVANDPLEESVEESAEIRLHPEMEAAAGLVAAMVPGSVLVRDERSSESVDLVIGEDFEGLDDMPEPDATADPCA